MRLLFGIQPPPWLIAGAGVAVLLVGYARGTVVAMVIGILIVVIALLRQFLL